jgi:hypothetical protein
LAVKYGLVGGLLSFEDFVVCSCNLVDLDAGFPFKPTLFGRCGDVEGVVCLFIVFDLSRRVIELEGIGTVMRGAEAAA